MIIKVYTQRLNYNTDRYEDSPEIFIKVAEDGEYLAQWPNMYGADSVPGIWRKQAYNAKRLYVDPIEYAMVAKLPSPSYAYQVKSYAHLR
jgi:hypothetical protein